MPIGKFMAQLVVDLDTVSVVNTHDGVSTIEAAYALMQIK